MTIEESNKIIEALRQDDLAALQSVVGQRKNLRLGRFPLLSLCYLYRSRRIIRACFALMQQGVELEIPEPSAAYRDFVQVAGRALRLFAGSTTRTVLPAYMLALTGQWRKLRATWSQWALDDEQQETLLAAIRLRFSVEARYDRGKIVLPAKPMPQENRSWFAVAMTSAVVLVLLAVAVLAVGLPVVGRLTLHEGAATTYSLTRNVTLQGDLQESAVTIEGNGHVVTVNVGEKPFFETFRGTLKNCTLRLVGDRVTAGQAYAVFCVDNYGTFDNVSIVCKTQSGTLTIALEGMQKHENEEGVLVADKCGLGVLCVNNYGRFDHCSVAGNVTFVSNENANAQGGVFASYNYGQINGATMDCVVQGQTVDLGGVAFCNEAEGRIVDCALLEDCLIRQTTSVYEWNPYTGGVVAVNYGVIENTCVQGDVNNHKVDVEFPEQISRDVSTWPIADCGGIAANNFGVIRHCVVSGSILAGSGSESPIYADGVNACVGAIAGNNLNTKETTAVLEGNIATTSVVVQGNGYSNNIGGLCGINTGNLVSNIYAGGLSVGNNSNYGTIAGAMSGSVEIFGDTISGNYALALQMEMNMGFFQQYVSVPIIGLFVPDEEQYGRATIYAGDVQGIVVCDSADEIVALEEYWYEN